MASTNIKLFDENKSNMMSDTTYNSDNQRANGVQTGIASSELQNKFQYQMSLVAYAIAQLMLANGVNALDSDTVTTFVSNLSSSVVQKVLDKASDAVLKAQTDDTKWVSAKGLKSAPKGDKITLSLPTASWTASGNNFVQTVTIPSGTTTSQVDLQGDATVIQQMLDDGVTAIFVSNADGVFTVTAMTAAPTVDLTVQGTVTEYKEVS